MVEVARLESVYRFIAYRGFESPSLRHRRKKKKLPSGSFFFRPWRREAGRLRALRGGFEGSGLPARPSPNRPTAAAARQPRAPAARVRGSN